MKKFIATVAAGSLCMSMLLAGCSSNTTTTGDTTQAESTETTGAESTEATETEEESRIDVSAYDLDSMVTLGEYKGIEVAKIDTTVTDEEVTAYIDSVLASHATPEQLTDKTIEDGDTVNIDYVGLKDGVAFDGGSATGTDLTIGSGSFIDGFESGLVGHTPGEKVNLELTFPEDYGNAELAGAAVIFNVTINYVNGDSITPELTDEFVAGLGGEETTVEEYQTATRATLEESKQSEAEQTQLNEIIAKVVDNSTVSEVPQELIDQYYNDFVTYYEYYAQMYGTDLASFIESMGTTEDEFYESASTYGDGSAKQVLVMYAIAKTENLTIDDAAYQEKALAYAASMGLTDVESLETYYSKEDLIESFLFEEVQNFLLENAVEVDAPETTEAETTESETADASEETTESESVEETTEETTAEETTAAQ